MDERLYINKRTLSLTGLLFLILLFNGFSRTALPVNTYANLTVEWTFYTGFVAMVILLLKQRHVVLQSDFRLFYGLVLLYVLGISSIDLLKDFPNDDLIQLLLYISFFLAVVHIRWNAGHIQVMGIIASIVLLLFVWQWLDGKAPINRYQGDFTNPNLLGVFTASLLYFPLAVFKGSPWGLKPLYGLSVAAGLVITYVSTARSAVILLAVTLLAWLVLCFSRNLFYYLFYLVVVGSGLFVISYHLLAKSNHAIALNEWSLAEFGKRFFSGRQNIWGNAIEYGLQSPLFGHRIGILPEDFMEGSKYWHTHNQFVQVFLESGLVGLALFVLLLYGIWKMFQRHLDSSIVRLAACFFLGIIVYQTVEISLFFNMKPVGLIHWLIMGIGVSGVLFSRSPSELK